MSKRKDYAIEKFFQKVYDHARKHREDFILSMQQMTLEERVRYWEEVKVLKLDWRNDVRPEWNFFQENFVNSEGIVF